uniref:Secreted protein n=1 Tax=Trichuris muris TaxID=70415 RepID=A0A5S6Q1X1_TRIMR
METVAYLICMLSIPTCSEDTGSSGDAEVVLRRACEFAGDHPTLWRFIDGLRKVQAGRDKEYEDYVRGEQPQPKRQRYIQADRRILAIVRRNTYSATLTVVASTDPSDVVQPLSEDRWAKDKSAEVVRDRITTFAQNSDRILRCEASAKLAATAAVGRLRRRPRSRHPPNRAATVAVGRLQYGQDVVQFSNRLCMYSLSYVYGSRSLCLA